MMINFGREFYNYDMTILEMNFTDKQSYLDWKEAWRDQYKQLSKDIREAKRRRSEKISGDHAWWYQVIASEGRDYARAMMEARETAKERSHELKSKRAA